MEVYQTRSMLSRSGSPDTDVGSTRNATLRPAVRINPYIPPMPTIGRLLDILWAYGPAGTLIDTSNRELAKALGRSVSMIPSLLHRLEADGHITRVTGTRGTLIEVLR